MEIVVETTSCHQVFGGYLTKMYKYNMSEGKVAEEKFLELSKNDCDYQRTSIRIVLTNDNH